MLQNKLPEDFIIATGKTHSLKDFVKKVCEFYGLDFNKVVILNSKEDNRPADFKYSYLDPSRIYNKLGWKAENSLDEIIMEMCKNIW